MHSLPLIFSIIVASVVTLGATIGLIAVRRAPEGFEDVTGFHRVRGSEVRDEDEAPQVASSRASLV